MMASLWLGHRSSGVCSDYRTRTFSAPNGRFLEAFAVLHGQVKTGGRTRQNSGRVQFPPQRQPPSLQPMAVPSLQSERIPANETRSPLPLPLPAGSQVSQTPQPLNSFQPLSNA